MHTDVCAQFSWTVPYQYQPTETPCMGPSVADLPRPETKVLLYGSNTAFGRFPKTVAVLVEYDERFAVAIQVLRVRCWALVFNL